MSFNTGAKLDPSQVEDVRGSRIGGRGLMVGGGGGIGIIVALVWVLLGGSPQTGQTVGGLVGQTIGGGAAEPGPASSALAAECQTGADANASEDCRIVGYVNSIQAYWRDEFAASGQQYAPARTRFFTDQISTGCGTHRQPAARSTARATSTSTSTSGSSTSFARSSAPRAARSPRPTSSRTSTATTSRTWLARCGRDEPGRGPGVGPVRAAGRLLRGRVGGNAATTGYLEPLRTRRSPTRWTPPRPWVTTGSRRRCRARSTPRPGPTARPPSARSGSRPATRLGRRTGCDTFSGNP